LGGATAASLKIAGMAAGAALAGPLAGRSVTACAEYARNLGYVRQVLREGNERANEIASVTLAELQAAMGMRY
jgi:tryptophanyl-tRNA synthetase